MVPSPKKKPKAAAPVAAFKALTTSLDGNPEIRKALIERITKSLATTKAPVVVLHQMAMMLEMDSR